MACCSGLSVPSCCSCGVDHSGRLDTMPGTSLCHGCSRERKKKKREKPCKDGTRHRSGAAISQEVPRAVSSHRKLGERCGTELPEGTNGLPTSGFQTSGLQNYEGIQFCCLFVCLFNFLKFIFFFWLPGALRPGIRSKPQF